MRLNQIFESIAIKKLSRVDIAGISSNQHEINGVTALRDFFQTTERYSAEIPWYVFTLNYDKYYYYEKIKFYDARERSYLRTGRSEWRMYYSGDFIKLASPEDYLILLKLIDGRIMGLIIQTESPQIDPLLSIFNLSNSDLSNHFRVITSDKLVEELDFSERQFLESIEININIPEDKDFYHVAEKELSESRNSNKTFPSTKRLAELARDYVDIDSNDFDGLLINLIEAETKIFLSIESLVVEEKLAQHFSNVNDFLSYSLSIQNRRKSRMGLALQNHLSFLFQKSNIHFDSQQRTEGKNTPDFIFPGIAYYLNDSFNPNHLTMLAAKSTCKERWRQILTEANRIEYKHLCTLDPSISLSQMDEMDTQHVKLVIPKGIANLYGKKYENHFASITQFINELLDKQSFSFLDL